jgi:SAM-dependent methyltransferase
MNVDRSPDRLNSCHMTPFLKITAKKMLEGVDPLARGLYRLSKGFSRPIPPMRFRARTAARWVGRFIDSGKACADALTQALNAVQAPAIYEFDSILDFGCGCGRTLLYWDLQKLKKLTGCDIDCAAIDWLRGAYPARCHPNLSLECTKFDPPLPFAEGQFDLIYSVSIFSHLSGEDQAVWLAELSRVLRPGGLALLTVQGHCAVKVFANTTAYDWATLWAGHDLEREAFVYLPIAAEPGAESAPGVESASRLVSYGLTFMTRKHIDDRWNSARMAVVDVFEGTLDGLQDVVVLRRK